MILAFDVGNTNIVLGGIDRERIYFLSRLSTHLDKTDDEYTVLIKSILDLYEVSGADIDGCIISSVVPPLVNTLKNVIMQLTGQRSLVVGPGVKTGLRIACGDPTELGADLVVAAVAALAKYSGPMVVLDLGTATTFSVIARNSDFIGVIICPGVMVSFDALTANTAQLPRISFDEPRRVIGATSVDSMQSGLIYGNAAMIDGIIERIEEELGETVRVIATGGIAGNIIPHCRREITIDDNLLLEGLRIIYYKNRRK